MTIPTKKAREYKPTGLIDAIDTYPLTALIVASVILVAWPILVLYGLLLILGRLLC